MTFSNHHQVFLPSSTGQDIMWYRADTSLPPLVPFLGEESLRSPVLRLSESPELRILISHFPRDHTDPCDTVSSLRLAQGQGSHTTIHRCCQKLNYLQERGIHQNQPTFEMLWTSWTCCYSCIMLHWLKDPKGIYGKSFLHHSVFGKIGKVLKKRAIPLILNVLAHYL